MNLYLIEQEVNLGYDTYDSAVVVAESEGQAVSIHPSHGLDWDGIDDKYLSTWCDKEHVKATLIGTTEDSEPKVVLASYYGS